MKGQGLGGRVSLNDHVNRFETDRLTRDGDWSEVEVIYSSGSATNASINILHVAMGDGYFDDVKFCELTPVEEPAARDIVGVAGRGEEIFFNHVARCVLCHTLKSQGSTVGPPLDGIATRKDQPHFGEFG